MSSLRVAIWVILLCAPNIIVESTTDSKDVGVLLSLKQLWQNVPPSWNRSNDPCGNQWEGITCNGPRVISIMLSSMGLNGILSGDIQGLSELQTLDLSYNKGLSGNLPPAIGKLSNLTNLILAGCNFNGELPDTIGSLSELVFLSLNSNSFSGKIPRTIGNLSKLYWLDLSGNKLTGTIPISNGTTPGLDLLIHTSHFHFGRNQLSGEIEPQLFNENMTLLHLLLDNNQFSGSIPTTLGLVKTLEVVRLDWNSLSGSVPSSISSLTSLSDMFLSNNQLTGPMPDLTGMNLLNYLDMSNNSFEASDVPSWVTDLPALTTLMMERTQMKGAIPTALFSLSQLQKVVLKNNKVSGVLDLGAVRSSQLQTVDLQNNNISAYTQRPGDDTLQLILVANPICVEMVTMQSHCVLPGSNPSYTTPQNCAPTACTSNKVSSPNCRCAYPYTGTLTFRAPQFSNLNNITNYEALERDLMTTFQSNELPVNSVSLSNITRQLSNYLDITLQIFPLGQDRFNRTSILTMGFILSNQTFKPPPYYGPYIFIADSYITFSDGYVPKKKRSVLPAVLGGTLGPILAVILAYLGYKKCCAENKCNNNNFCNNFCNCFSRNKNSENTSP